jgi:hypothetical protein
VDLAGLHGEIDAVVRRQGAKAFGDAAQFDGWESGCGHGQDEMVRRRVVGAGGSWMERSEWSMVNG